jgi:hypothetical protein
MGFLSRAGQILLGTAVVGAAVPSCYSAGAGTSPPPKTFYFPVGLAVSSDGNVLYAVNSDFDLQWNGGTLQSYDLGTLRVDAANRIANPPAGCPESPPPGGVLLGQRCAPPTPSETYFKDSATIGAFATDLQVSVGGAPAVPGAGPSSTKAGPKRLFIPVRGDATVTWAAIGTDPSNPWKIECGQPPSGRCDAAHQAGNDPNQPGNTRQVTMPGEPFGIAQTEDGRYLAVTSQTTPQTSLLTTGFPSPKPPADPLANDPTMEFVLGGMPIGGIGIAAVPHDPDAPPPGWTTPPVTMSPTTCQDPAQVAPCPSSRCEDVGNELPCVRPAFLETSRSVAEIDLLRLYDDDGSSQSRPFLAREAAFPITSNAVGTDSRGIVIDPTPRISCKSQCGPGDQACRTACGQLAARVFFASRTPPALGLGEIGGPPPNGEGAYDPDRLVLTGNVPLPTGPSNVYLAPIIDRAGNFALRVFVVCFDSNQIVVYDPDAGAVDNVINVGAGPFAMAFDPFVMWDVGRHSSASDAKVPYRFAYVASFTQSYVQMIDLDSHQPTAETFENIVFTLGQPTLPKGQ